MFMLLLQFPGQNDVLLSWVLHPPFLFQGEDPKRKHKLLSCKFKFVSDQKSRNETTQLPRGVPKPAHIHPFEPSVGGCGS